jgi:Flp pilus assembly protein TadD
VQATELGIELSSNDNTLKSEFFAQQGEAYFGLKKFTEGKAAYENSLKLTPSNVLVKNNFAYRLATAKIDLGKAETLIKEVVQNNGQESHFLDTYAWVLFQQGNYAEAKTQIMKAYQLKPKDKVIVEHLGDILFKEGKVNEAVNYWMEAKTLGSSNQNLDKKIEQKNYYEPLY